MSFIKVLVHQSIAHITQIQILCYKNTAEQPIFHIPPGKQLEINTNGVIHPSG